MRIIVTGATSMVGAALVSEALSNNDEVYAIVRSNTMRMKRLPASEKLHIIEGNLESLASLEAIPDCDLFYHFAWCGTKKEDRDNPIIQTRNISYTFDAIELARRSGCKKFICAGSQAEYGATHSVVDDDTGFKPTSSYGATKYATSILGRKLCDEYGMIFIWARIFSIYGRYDNENTMLDYAIKHFLKGEKAKFSAGTQNWDYLNEKDGGRIFYLLGIRIEASSEYRVAYGEARPLRDYIDEIVKQMQADELCEFLPPEDSKVYGIESDESKLFKDIGFQPQIPFSEGIRDMIGFYKEEYEHE